MKKDKLFFRFITFIIGLFIMAFGVALSVKANLGVSPISCIPYIYSLKYPLTMGEITILFNVLLIFLQMLVLRRKYQLFQLIQFPIVFLFGFFTDFTLHLVSNLTASNYLWQVILCLLSCIILAFGVFLEVKASVTYLPGEGLAMAITKTFNKEFGKAKIGVDCSFVAVGTISSFILLHHLAGVREGTILAALLVGYLAKLYGRKLTFINTWFDNGLKEQIPVAVTATSQNAPVIITISREYGSGGHEIGQLIAQQLGFAFYDKELIKLTAEESGFTTTYIEQHEQKLANNLLYDLYEQNYAYQDEQLPPLDALFLVQSKVIRDIARKESCVIVGRCANFILKDQPQCYNIFIHANKEFRKNKINEEYGVKVEDTEKIIERTDRERANHCRHYTGKVWNDATNYHLTLDSSLGDTATTVQTIIDAFKTNVITKQ